MTALAAFAGIALLAAAGPTTHKSAQPGALPDKQPTYETVSRPSDMRELGFAIRGRVGELLVKPGDKVTKGQLLMRLDASVQRQIASMYRLEAEDQSKVKMAQTALTFREEDLRITKDSNARGGAAENDVREAQFRRDSAEIEVAQALHQKAVNQQMLNRELATLEQMEMTAPFDGTVLEIKKRPGEIVEENSQAVTIVNIDPLWLDVNVPTREAVKFGLGQTASVTWEDLDAAEPMQGKIVFISPFGHGGARQIQIRVEVPNPGAIPSGLHGSVKFGPALPPAASTGSPQPGEKPGGGTPSSGPGGQTAPGGGTGKPNP